MVLNAFPDIALSHEVFSLSQCMPERCIFGSGADWYVEIFASYSRVVVNDVADDGFGGLCKFAVPLFQSLRKCAVRGKKASRVLVVMS